MVGSPFIQINKNGARIILNTNQIVLVHDEDTRLTESNRKYRYTALSPEQEMVYVVDLILVGGRGYELMYESKEDRDAMLDQLLKVVSPSITLESPAGLPVSWPEFARREPEPVPGTDKKLYRRDEVFLTREEFEGWRQDALEEIRQAEQSPEPPIPKPPRKPYTRKPRE